MRLDENGGVYTLTFEDGIEMRFERIHEDSKGVVTAEIWIQNLAATNPHLHQTRTTITSGETSTKIGNVLKTRYEVVKDWPLRIEAARVSVLNRFRKGEPIVNLQDVKASEALEYVIQPFVFKGQPTLLYGAGGLGKSLQAMYFAMLCAAGISDDICTVEPTNVLYLDWETEEQEARRRWMQVAEGLNLVEPPRMDYRFCVAPLAHDLVVIQKHCIENNIGLVISDSAAPAVGGEPSDTGLTITYFTALRALKVASITVAHERKEAPDSAGPFGSVFWTNLPRSVWRLKAVQEPSSNRLDLGLFHIKTNNGPLERARGYRVDFERTPEGYASTAFSKQDIGGTQLASDLPLTERLSTLLKSGGRTLTQIMDELGLPDSRKSYLKSLLSGSPKYISLGNEQWGNAELGNPGVQVIGNPQLPW